MKKSKITRLFSPTVFITSLVVLFVTTLWALGAVSTFEKLIFDFLYNIPPSWNIVVLNITHFGSTAALYSMVFVLFVFGHKKLSLILLGNGIATYLLAWAIKEFVMRPRPAELWQNVNAYEWGVLGFGFPSGHTAMIVAIAATLWIVVAKPYRYILFLTALLVAVSRITLGVHLPLDIIGGAALGLVVVQTSNFIRDTAIKINKDSLK